VRFTGQSRHWPQVVGRSIHVRPGTEAKKRSRWKQGCVIFLVFFPLSLMVNVFSAEFTPDWPILLRVLAGVVVMTPVMTYLALPWITKRMEWWLLGKPVPWR